MITRNLTVTVGRKLTKDYCSQEVRYSLEIELERGDDAQAILAEVSAQLKAQVTAAMKNGNHTESH